MDLKTKFQKVILEWRSNYRDKEKNKENKFKNIRKNQIFMTKKYKD